MNDIVKRAPLKILIARRRDLLRGPTHIFFAISISIATYYVFNYFKFCWVMIDAFCPTTETSNQLFKVLIAITQFLGIGLLLWDLDERMQTLTGAKLTNYFISKIKAWWSLFFIRGQHVSSSASASSYSGGVVASSAYQKMKTVDEQLEYLQRRIIEVESRIAKESGERKDLERKIESDLKKVYSAIDDSKNQVMKTVTKIHVGGYTRQLWSLFLIAYSAVLSVFV
ncbi:hypothetical protein [Rheinheimera baltica]|uniref:hypothetical protein n=1 Tax=Rheinheimera baltica TaxID=67576 RepID=UPI0003FE272A|nr:hypothetical protein [Rheinheimera baltica]